MMKFINFLLVFAIFISFFFSPIVLLAQSNVLPEKTTVTSDDNKLDTNQSDNKLEEKGSESILFWASIIVVLMLVGLALLFLEIAVIPGFGVAGISGSILLLLSLILAFWKLTKIWAIGVTLLAVIGVIFLALFVIYVLPHTRLGKAFILEENAPSSEEVFDATEYNKYLGLEGVAVSNLRPSGIVKIGNDRVDVVTDGDFIEKGTKIKVIKTEGRRVVVTILE